MSKAPRGTCASRTVLWLVGVAVLVAGLAAALFVGAARSATSASGLIAFTRPDGIYVMHPDGSGVRALRRGGVAANAAHLDWSPDGRRLAFESGGSIWVIGSNGNGIMRIVSSGAIHGQAHSPTWSADGRRIAFSLWTAEGTRDKEVWVVTADGSNPRRLMRLPGLGADNDGCAGVGTLDWSPDGKRIALTANCSWLAWVYVVNTNGRNLRNLTTPTTWVFPWAGDPHWSPDGSRIVFEQWPPTRQGTGGGDDLAEIYVMHVDNGSQIRLTTNGVSDSTPVWSPDGRRIAFVHGIPWAGTSEISVVNADGSGLTRLTHNNIREGNPAWQPVAAR